MAQKIIELELVISGMLIKLVIECDNNCSETGARETLGLQFLYSHEAISR